MKHDANDIIRQHGTDGLRAAFDDSISRAHREDLLLSSWLQLKLPPRDYLLGNVFCTTSRWIIYGETGVGKTLFALDMAGAIASGSSFLNWSARRKARVMYLDGEMPAETFRERMQLVADQFGSDISLFGYNREVLADGEMPPLNTPEGEAWLWQEIDLVKPDIIFCDSIMCLLTGSMSEEESWAPAKLLIRKISSKRIAQCWLHHTGHDSSKGFGTKTREWELDTVISLTAAESDQGVALEFKKARLRTPKTADDFKSQMIVRTETGWSSTGAEVGKTKGGRQSEQGNLKLAILTTYDRLADTIATSNGFDAAPVRKVAAERLREELKSRGHLESKDSGGLTTTARSHFHRAKAALLSEKRLFEEGGLVWK